jgi:hypothetical protein
MNGFSQNSSSDTNRIIEIKIDGLKRTKQRVAEEPLQQFLGMNAETINLDDVSAAILGLGILDLQEVGIIDAEDGSGKILWVSVMEKWTIFPIPLFVVNSSGYSAGLMFMDSNAFGLNDKFALGGMYGSSGWMAALMYFHQGRKGLPGWNTAAVYSSNTEEYQNQEDESIRRFKLNSLSAMLGLTYDFNELLSSRAQVSFFKGEISQDGDSFAVPEDDGYYLGASIGAGIAKNGWDGYFLSNKSLSVSFDYSYGLDGPSYYTLQMKGNFEHPLLPKLLPGLKTIVKSALIYSPDAPPLFESSASSADIDILPGSFSAKNYLGGSAGLEKSLFRFSFGTLSSFASYQFVYSDGPILDQCIDHGVAGGIRFYMTKLALPALGIGVSYNVAASFFQAYFNLGMSF